MPHRTPLCLLVVALAGCAGQGDNAARSGGGDPRAGGNPDASNPSVASDRYAVNTARAPFYYFGPAQPKGPDRGLVKGETVIMIQRDNVFSKVRTLRGEEGYVATDLLVMLPPEPVLPPPPVFTLPSTRETPERLTVVPIDQMLEEPPLPSGGAETPLPAITPTP